MRRAVASFLAGLALLAASLGWFAFAARFSALNPERSDRVADVLLEHPAVQDAAARALAAALRRSLPPEAPVSANEADRIARVALNDPRSVAALRVAIVGAHQRLVRGTGEPVRLDAGPLAEAGRDALLAVHPELAPSVPAAPILAVELPTEQLPDLSQFRDGLGRVASTAASAAAAFLAVAFLLSTDRPGILRRAGRWAVAAGVGWAAFGWLLPYALSRASKPVLAVLGSLATAVAGPMVTPAVLLVAVGAAATVGGRMWRTARLPQPTVPAPPPPLAVPAPAPAMPYSGSPGGFGQPGAVKIRPKR